MNYVFFQGLSRAEAQEYLDGFLAIERDAIRESIADARCEGLPFDYSLATLGACLRWFVPQLAVSWAPLAVEVPDWVRGAHAQGTADFDEPSKTLLLRAGYYFGECFARLPGFQWTIGSPEYMLRNMPVVVGFATHHELAPLLVIENVFLRILADGKPIAEIENTIQVWRDSVRS